jgi:LysM repeat protein
MKKHVQHTRRLIFGSCAALSAVLLCCSGCAAKKEKVATGNFLMDNRGIIPPPHAKPVPIQVVAPVKAEPLPAIVESRELLVPLEYEGDIEQAFVPAEAPAAGVLQPKPLQEPDAEPAPLVPAVKPAASAPAPAPAAATTPKRSYTVVKGDTLSGIGYRYRIDWRDIAAVNGLSEKSVIREGQVLTLPEHAASTPRDAQTKRTSAASKSASPSKAMSLPADGIYEVKSGDSLWLIARRFNVKSDDIRRINNLKTDVLQVGQKLRLQEGSTQAAPSAAVKPAPAAPAVVVAPEVTLDAPAPAPADFNADGATEPAVLLGPVAPAGAGDDLLPLPPVTGEAAPTVGVAPPPVVDAPPVALKTLPHAVAAGDSIKQLVAMYGCAEDELYKVNPGVKSDADLKPGMTLQIPFK